MTIASGQKTVVTAGTEVRIAASQIVSGPVMVKALPANTGLIYIGNVDDVLNNTNGMPLAAGEVLIFDFVNNLEELWIDATVNGEGVAWLLLQV